jgi:hypothetical protein
MTDRHRQVIDEFRASHGKPGGYLAGLTLLLLTTTGAARRTKPIPVVTLNRTSSGRVW